MTAPDEIRRLVRQYEHKSSYGTEPNFDKVLSLGPAVVPFFAEAYPTAKRWRQRASFLYRSVRYAKESKSARELAVQALADKSREVRYRACMLLAVSQDRQVLPALRATLSHPDAQTRADVAAAIDAIERRNHNYFVDRGHTGMINLVVVGDDA